MTPGARTAVLPDVLCPDLAVVFCGTAASRRSAAVGAYYAHPGNHFWQALAECGLTPRRLDPQAFRDMPRFGIGFTDLAKHHAGNDDELPTDAFDTSALLTKLQHHRPRIIAFTSKTAARAVLGQPVDYGRQAISVGPCIAFVLPSPSGQARRYWSIEPWRALAREVHRSHERSAHRT